ncbi:MAG: putative sulfate exporter family transporter, partial [Burkholderiales bacterium]
MTSMLSTVQPASGWRELFSKEDWWAIWIGLGLLAASVLLFNGGSSMKWLAVTPGKWHTLSELGSQLVANAQRYMALFLLWAAILGVAIAALKISLRQFLPSFLFVYLVSTVIFFLGEWDKAHDYNLEPPLVALALGILIANVFRLPAWLESGFRVEFYIKTGIVLLGATLPFTLILWAGPVAIAQAAIVSLVTIGTIFFVGKRLGLDR